MAIGMVAPVAAVEGRVPMDNSEAAAAVDPGYFVGAMERWRLELGLSMNAFADYLGVSRSYYGRVRRGISPLTMGLAQRVLRERPELAYFLSADAATTQTT